MPFTGVDGLVNGLVCLSIDSHDVSQYVPVPLTKVHVEARVVNFVSQVTVTQNYVNKEKNPIEAIYFFPVEEEAAVIDFTAQLEGRTVKTVVKEKEEAKQEYQEAVRDRRTAFLLEETKPDIFQIHVGHLSPGSGCTISITYLSELPVEDGKTRLTVPTTVAPRYVPGDDKSEASGKIASIEYDYKTPANLTFKLETIMKTKIKGIESPSHNVVSKIESEADNNNFFIGETQFEGSTSDMDRDIVVLIETEEPNQPKIVLEKNEEGATVGMLSFVPSFELKDITAEIIFLVDCSGSMNGQSINLAQEALQLFLHSLPIDCYFNIVCFGSSFQSLFSESKKYDDITLDTAKNLAANLSANLGGTEILRPLEHIFNQKSIPSNPRQVFVLTDGEVSDSSRCINCVKKNNDTSRVFTLGIGSNVDRHLVKGMARAGQGTAVFATYGEKIAPKVLKQLKNSLQPCINNVKIDWGDGVQQGNIKWQKPVIETTKTLMGYGKPKAEAAGVAEARSAINSQAPNNIPAIYDGSRLLVYKKLMDGKYPANVTVTAETPDGALDLVLSIDKNNILEGYLVHQMFARKLIQDLEEGGDDFEQCYDFRNDYIKSQIVELGIKYRLASKFTSFVGVDEKQGKESRVMMTRQIKNQVAHGYGGWGGNLQRQCLTVSLDSGVSRRSSKDALITTTGSAVVPRRSFKESDLLTLTGGPVGPGVPMGAGGQIGSLGQMGQGGSIGPRGPIRPGGPMGPVGLIGPGLQIGPRGQMGPGGPMGPGGQMGPGEQMRPGGPIGTGGQMVPGGQMRPGGPMMRNTPFTMNFQQVPCSTNILGNALDECAEVSLECDKGGDDLMITEFCDNSVMAECAEDYMEKPNSRMKRKRSATDLSNNGKLIQLTSLQVANGSFKWGDIIEKVSNKSLVDIEAAAAMRGFENDVWLTAVVVMVIETQFDDDKESWEMIVEKAKKWLNKIGTSWDCLFSKVKEFVI